MESSGSAVRDPPVSSLNLGQSPDLLNEAKVFKPSPPKLDLEALFFEADLLERLEGCGGHDSVAVEAADDFQCL